MVASSNDHGLGMKLATDMDREMSSRTSQGINNGGNNNHDGMITPATNSTLTKTLQESFIDWRAGQGGTVAFDSERRAVQRFVRETLFSNLKFLRSENELEYNGKLRNKLQQNLDCFWCLTRESWNDRNKEHSTCCL